MSEKADVPLNPWNPITDPVTLKHIGKLQEELGELQAALARVLIQGIDEVEPVTKKSNRLWLTEEMGDVHAGLKLLVEHFDLDYEAMFTRAEIKSKRLREWHAMAGEG